MTLNDLGPDALLAHYNRIAAKIREEWPHDNPGMSNEESGVLLGFNEWKKVAIDGDVSAFADAQRGAVFGKRQAFLSARSRVQTIRDHTMMDWKGEAADDFNSYLNTVDTYLGDFVGGNIKAGDPEGYIPQVSAVVDMVFAVQLAFKSDLKEVALALEAAIDRMDDVGVDYRPAAIFGLKLAMIVVKQIPKADLVLEVADLMWDTAGMPDLNLEKAEKKEITGHEIIGVLRSFDAVFRDLVAKHSESVSAVSRHADQLLSDLESSTELTKLAAALSKELPTWNGHDGKSLKDLLSLGNQLETPAINDRAGKEKAPEMPKEKEEKPHPPGPPTGT
ncbi:hypothetical protein GCM10027598_63820 [Amycolatopsis oliviviridis]|uniref:Uncharacterized protein n=1 Tax=Amycolatopsis oliviviridis TaxID=1471590 RepID=A0ABQ3M4S0_9PSEU|nr:hypothetical protein [Amycolatopsis oliviviridis]GHH33463.1 hypothetical protein GCM10017790_72120 [Amycolatopsis oliviviridis]